MRHVMMVMMMCAVTVFARPKVMQTHFETADVVIADSVYQAVPGDNSKGLQAAINQLAAAGGGTLFLPVGEYSLEAPITVATGVVLRGDNPLYPNKLGKVKPGTVLAIRYGANQENGAPAITMRGGTGLRELVFWYPEQDYRKPIPYPWTVQFKANGINDSESIFNCRFVNPYKAIDFVTFGNELHTFRNTALCPLKLGIELDFTTDIGRISDVMMGIEAWTDSGLPGAPSPADLSPIPLAASTGIIIHRSDWEYTRGLEFRGLGIGMRFCKGPMGATNTAIAGAAFRGCATALHFDELYMIGVNAYDCVFEGVRPLVTTNRFTTTAQFNDCTFAGDARLPNEKPRLLFEGSGALSFRHCRFRGLEAAVWGGQAQFSDCEATDMRLHVDKTAKRLYVLGGTMAESAVVDQSADNQTQVIVSPIPEEIGDVKPFSRDFTPHRLLAPKRSGAVLMVTDFGASPAAEDNGPAFRQALSEAAKTKHSTVYVPAGVYRFKSNIIVPEDTELRGVADVPMHTHAGGSVLQIEHNHGVENAEAFLGLKRGASVRGVLFWYPLQVPKAGVPYPWTIQGLGRDVSIVDVSAGGPWQFIDLGSYDTTGHLINYAAGGCYRRGIRVAHSQGGDIIDVHLNPHYFQRHPKFLKTAQPGGGFDMNGFMNYQREHLEGLIFEDVKDEITISNFIFSGVHGLRILGNSQMRLLMHGSDMAFSPATLECDAPTATLDFALAQLTAFGDKQIAGLVTTPSFAGKATFVASQYWLGRETALLQGPGTVIFDELFTLCAAITVNNGTAVLSAPHFCGACPHHLVMGEQVKEVRTIGPVATGGLFNVKTAVPERYHAFATASVSTRAFDDDGRTPISFKADFETPQTYFENDAPTSNEGIFDMDRAQCQLVTGNEAHSGKSCVALTGHSGKGDHQFAYFKLLYGPFLVRPDTVLSYWIKPMNEASRRAAVDVAFTAGLPLRDYGINDRNGVLTHPANPRGKVGEWTKIEIPLGETGQAGLIIDHLMVAYDNRDRDKDFMVLIDDVEVSAQLPRQAYGVKFKVQNQQLTLDNPTEMPIRFTLNGLNPTETSPLYEKTLTLPKGVADIRIAFVGADGKLLPHTLSQTLIIK